MRVLGRVRCMHAWGGRKRKQSNDPNLGRQIQVYQNLDSLKVFTVTTQWLVLLSLRSSMTRSCHPEKQTSWGKRTRSSSKTSPNPGSDAPSQGPVGLDRKAPILTMCPSIWSLFCLYGSKSCCFFPVCSKVGSCRKLMDLCCLSATFFQPIWLVRHRQHQGL